MKGLLITRKAISLLLTVAMFLSVTVCYVSASDIDLSSYTSFVFDGKSVTVSEGTSQNYEVLVIDQAENETEPNKSADKNGNTVYSLPDGSDGILQVSIKKSGGSYVFSGDGTGAIKVAKDGTADAVIYLNGLTLNSDFTSAIVANKNHTKTVTVHAVKGTVNKLSDSVYNNDDVYTDNAVAEKAVIKAKAGTNLVICGEGTLNIDANGKNGIKASTSLTINDVTLNIDALDNGISGENTVAINSGIFKIRSAEGDGIKSCADDTPTGDITINGGTFDIDVPGDGIQATMNLNINGGTFNIVTYNGYNDENYDGDDDSYPSAKGLKASGSYIVTDDGGNETEVDATGCQLNVSGGTFDLNCADDAVHSDGDLTITGGIFTISSGDDAIHSEYITTIGAENSDNSALSIDINNCVEGIEGAKVNIYSGTHNIFSTDDAINAANSELKNYSYQINVYGSNIYASSYNGDCFDSNGSLTIYDGYVVALGGIISSDNDALDCDGMLSIKGGTVLTVQKGSGMQNSTGGQTCVVWTSTGDATASASGKNSRPGMSMGGLGSSGSGFVSNGSEIVIYDDSGNEIIRTTAKWNQNTSSKAGKVMLSSNNLESGKTYTLSVDDYSNGASSSNSSILNFFQIIVDFFTNVINMLKSFFNN